jgi:hypothetical protein
MENCNNLNLNLGSEYMHKIPINYANNVKDKDIFSTGIYYANGDTKIIENSSKRGKKQLGGSKHQEVGLKNKMQYLMTYKSPSYYLDFGTTVGGRPEIRRNDNDIPHYMTDNGELHDKKFNYECAQPKWSPNCK